MDHVAEGAVLEQKRDDVSSHGGSEVAALARAPATVDSGQARHADYRPAPGSMERTGSWLQSATENLDIIELAQRIDGEGRAATPEEQARLARYVGFGAATIRNALYPVPSAEAKSADPARLIWPSLVTRSGWRALAERLERLLAAWQRSILQSTAPAVRVAALLPGVAARPRNALVPSAEARAHGSRIVRAESQRGPPGRQPSMDRVTLRCTVQVRCVGGLVGAVERRPARASSPCSCGAGSSRTVRWSFALDGTARPAASAARERPAASACYGA